MGIYLGIDTSNYTTSAALYDSGTGNVRMEKKLLPVPKGKIGLKQSDAVFHHVRQLPEVLEQLYGGKKPVLDGIGVSAMPRRQSGSYMPCFLTGKLAAKSAAFAAGVPLYEFSHQEGHIMAALFSAGKMDFLDEEFYAFHISGGTTECLLVRYEDKRFQIQLLSRSLDLKAGQVVDRVGAMLGLPFPAGPELDTLSRKSGDIVEKVRPCLKGLDCSLSGLENQCKALLGNGVSREYIAKYCIMFILETVSAMTQAVFQKYGEKHVLYAGGVMSNSMIRQELAARFGGFFAEPAYSSDNGAGAAILAAKASA